MSPELVEELYKNMENAEGFGPGRKDDQSKCRVDLLPVRALLAVANVMTFGAAKYGANNWQGVTPKRRYYGAALRHLFARALGEKTDPESGLPHLAHAGCCILFMLSGELGHDDPDAFEEPPTTDLAVGKEVVVLEGAHLGEEGKVSARCGCRWGDDCPAPWVVALKDNLYQFPSSSLRVVS